MAALSEEQTLIRDQAKSWVTQQAPVQKFRQMRDSGTATGFSPDSWAAMVEMGWTGLLIPEAYGGSGLGYLTFGLILEETGRQLTASPLFASGYVGAGALLLGASEAQKQQWLPGIADGSEIFTLAVQEGARHAPHKIALNARADGTDFVLNGQKSFVIEGGAASQLIVAARTGGSGLDGLTLFIVPAAAAGLQRERLYTADSRGYANLSFENVRVSGAQVLGQVDGGGALLEQLLDRAVAGVAAEMQGTAAQAFDMTLEYLQTRKQFGRVIGSFQALGHRAAGLYTAMELARSCMEAALQAIDSGADDVPELCALSKCRVGDFLHEMSNQLIQIHGGIGMTDEFDAGFYLKRARALEALYGNQAFYRDRYARLRGF